MLTLGDYCFLTGSLATELDLRFLVFRFAEFDGMYSSKGSKYSLRTDYFKFCQKLDFGDFGGQALEHRASNCLR